MQSESKVMKFGQLFFCVILTVAMLLGIGSCQRNETASEVPTVYIISPHASDIQREFGDGFAAWHLAKYKTPAQVKWPNLGGGTSVIVRYLDAQYKANGSAGVDLVFGGGSGTFDDLLRAGFIVPPTPALPKEVTDTLPREFQGIPMRGPNDVWFGATMSYFGIIVNKDRLRELKLDRPTKWENLAEYGWFDELSLADPSKSGSVRTCYEMVLQQYGWEKGWPILVKMFANAQSIREGGSNPAEEAGLGNAAAGVVIDFFGRFHIAKQGSKVLEFIVPEGGSSLDPDPIAMLKNGPNPELASRFMEYVLSAEGQRLWVLRPGTPGGPKYKTLGRMSLRREIYEKETAYLTDPMNPFVQAPPLKLDRKAQSLRSAYLGDLIRSCLIDEHEALKAARKAAHAAGDKPEVMAMFDRLPFTAEEMAGINALYRAKDPKEAERNQAELRMKWRSFYSQLAHDIADAAAK